MAKLDLWFCSSCGVVIFGPAAAGGVKEGGDWVVHCPAEDEKHLFITVH